MYQVTRAVLRSKTSFSDWTETNFVGMTLKSFTTNYVDGYLKLTSPSIQGSFYVNYKTLLSLNVPYPNITLTAWLSNLTIGIPFQTVEPMITNSYLMTLDPFKFCLVNYSNASRDEVTLVYKQLPRTPNNQYLVCADGFFVKHVYNANLGEITFPYKTHSDKPSIQLLATDNFDDIQTVGLSNAIINPEGNIEVCLNQSLDEACILVALGGRLFSTEGNIHVVNREKGIIVIDVSKSQLPELFYHMQRHNRISEVTTDSIIDKHVSKTLAMHPEAIRRLMSDDGSFVAIVRGYGVLSSSTLALEFASPMKCFAATYPEGYLINHAGYSVPFICHYQPLSVRGARFVVSFPGDAALKQLRIDQRSDHENSEFIMEHTLPLDYSYSAPKIKTIKFSKIE